MVLSHTMDTRWFAETGTIRKVYRYKHWGKW